MMTEKVSEELKRLWKLYGENTYAEQIVCSVYCQLFHLAHSEKDSGLYYARWTAVDPSLAECRLTVYRTQSYIEYDLLALQKYKGGILSLEFAAIGELFRKTIRFEQLERLCIENRVFTVPQLNCALLKRNVAL